MSVAIVKPRIRGFICTMAHPVGCVRLLERQIARAKHPLRDTGPRTVLVIGGSTGYGLATRVVAAFGHGADTVGVSFERAPRPGKPASPGWYNNRAFEAAARREGRLALTWEGDAFSSEAKQAVAATLRRAGRQVDLVVYSLAAPVRRHPGTGTLHRSVLKPIGAPFVSKSVDIWTGEVSPVEIAPASPEEIAETIAVMGGEDWELWIDHLSRADVLSDGFKTLAFSYVGGPLTWPIYRDGTIGRAKADLDRSASKLRAAFGSEAARVVALKAIVTQASAAIPVVPLYGAALMKVMAAYGVEEDSLDQARRLLDGIYRSQEPALDAEQRLRLDEYELSQPVQTEIDRIWPKLTSANVGDFSDIERFRTHFLNLFGFGVAGIDYDRPVDLMATDHARPASNAS